MPTGTRSLSGNNRRILFAMIAVRVVIAFGAAGFYLIEGWSYQSAARADGYHRRLWRPTPTTPNGRIFSVVFMLAGVGVVLYALRPRCTL